MKDTYSQGVKMAAPRAVQENDGVPRVAPKWLKHDRQVSDSNAFANRHQVLNFKCYFQEPVVEDPNENYRVRKCTLFFYLEDDTCHIIENRIENSGIP